VSYQLSKMIRFYGPPGMYRQHIGCDIIDYHFRF